MATPSIAGLELNELKWWSNWAHVKRLGTRAYMLTSDLFQEPFFNRACFVGCGAVSAHREKAEKEFRRLGLPPTMTVNRSCSSALRMLAESGYHPTETMSVMVATRRTETTNPAYADVRETSAGSVSEWTKAYLLSFYGDVTLTHAVTKVAQRLLRSRSATLLEARLDGAVAGVLAIYRTQGLAGIYCVGTVPKFRRKGVAGTLLQRTSEIASSEGRRMILQTLRSDGAEAFYAKRGFAALYHKSFMGKET